MADFCRQGPAAGFRAPARSDQRRLLLNANHGVADLMGHAGHRFPEGGKLFALHQMILEPINAGVGVGERLQRSHQIGAEKILLEGKQQRKQQNSEQRDIQAET